VVVADFFTGFIVGIGVLVLLIFFMTLVLASLLVAWRIRRMRQAEEQG
jgi:hypothetical protein